MALHKIDYGEIAKAAGDGASQGAIADLLSAAGLSPEDSKAAAGNIIKGDEPEQAVQTIVTLRKGGGISPLLIGLFGIGVVAIFLLMKKGKGLGSPKAKKKRKKK